MTTKEVKMLVPEQTVLEYMKRLEKYLQRKVVPLKADIVSFASRYRMSVAQIKETQAGYLEDVRCIHRLCDVVAKLPEERRRRNQDKIKADLTALVSQANPKEQILINAKEEFEGSIASIKDKVKEIALTIKKVQIDTTEQDYDIMVKSDFCLIDIINLTISSLKKTEHKIEHIISMDSINNHKKMIEEEYLRRDGGQNHLYSATWKPFQGPIQQFNSEKETGKVNKMYNSFRFLIESIEWSFEAANQEYHYLNILSSLQRMHGVILSKRQEIEYSRVRPDDCAHPLTREYIVFYQKLVGNLMTILADSFYGNPLHKVLIDVLQVRNNFFDQMKINFQAIKAKFKESKQNYYIAEYWETLSSMIYDFMERVYTNNVHQKLRINESVLQMVIDFRLKIQGLAKEISDFHATFDEGIISGNSNYQKLILDCYNSYIKSLKDHYMTVKIEEGYRLAFEKQLMNFNFNPNFIEPNLPIEYTLLIGIPVPETTGSDPWKISEAAKAIKTDNDVFKQDLDRNFQYFIKGDYNWVKLKSFKIPEYSMEDYLNMFLRARVIKVGSKYYPAFPYFFMDRCKETPISVENWEPSMDKEILPKGFGKTSLHVVKEKEAKIKIPFMPSTFTSIQDNVFYMLNPRHTLQFTKTVSKGLPGSDTFYVLFCIETIDIDEPNQVFINLSFAHVITASSMLESTIREAVPKEVAHSAEVLENCIFEAVRENNPKVAEKDPSVKVDSNNVYDKKMLHTVQFKNMKDRSEELFASLQGLQNRQEREAKAAKRRYLGEYDKRAIYHAGPEAFNPDYEDIFNVRRVNQNKVDEAVDFFMTLKEKNLGLVEEITEKQKFLLSKVRRNPDKYIDKVKNYLKDPKILVIIFLALLLVILKIYDF